MLSVFVPAAMFSVLARRSPEPAGSCPEAAPEQKRPERPGQNLPQIMRIRFDARAVDKERRQYDDGFHRRRLLETGVGEAAGPEACRRANASTATQSLYAFVNGFRIGEAKNLFSFETRSILDIA